jgi:alkanesulfonate monooxygenase SsuD/methylene tetrahydromethanopterin reductase-like flavin-dependent oxidoreductase (luciferase family)
MKVGLFDHIERSDRALADQFDERLAFAAAAEQAGFYCLHVAEHHCTPLNMVPAPSVYLAAVARLTKRIHFGPLVYLLPLYSPLRLAEEICMLDQLGRGRLEVGVGRGVSPFELRYNKIEHDKSRDIFIDAFDCVVEALTHETFSYAGKHFSYADTPMPLRPYQQPHPAFWYGSSNATGATWSGDHGMNFVANGPTGFAKPNINAFKAAFAKRGGAAQPKPEFPGGAAIGILRHIVVAPTDADAQRIAKPAFEYHLASLNWLRSRHGSAASGLNVPRGQTFEAGSAEGTVIAGAPQAVIDTIAAQSEALGINYLVTYPYFGTMTNADARRSLDLFAEKVLPAIAKL